MFSLTRREQASPDLFDDLFRGYMIKPFQIEASAPQIKLDVKEGEKVYTIHAEIPGVKKEDIHVDIDKNRISISAKAMKGTEEKKGEVVLRSERYYGAVSRVFTLGEEIDESTASAKYTDGVLELTLPKKTAVASKRLAIS